MAKAKNKVIAGDYIKKDIFISGGTAVISAGFLKTVELNERSVESYEVVDETSKKSAASAIGRAAVGSFFLGPVGLAAALSAKSKGIHTIAIQFKDGRRSLLEVDDKIYKAIITKVF